MGRCPKKKANLKNDLKTIGKEEDVEYCENHGQEVKAATRSQMSKKEQQHLSELLSYYLNYIGFDEESHKRRIKARNHISKSIEIATQKLLNDYSIEKFMSGSQREGVGFGSMCDLDLTQVRNVVCCHSNELSSGRDGTKVVFKMVRENAPPGYCFLKLDQECKQNKFLDELEYALEPSSDGQSLFLSSDTYMERNDDVICMIQEGRNLIGRHINYKERCGPSIPKCGNVIMRRSNPIYKILKFVFNLIWKDPLNYNIDLARAFPCYCPDIMDAWRDRKRGYGWPPRKLIKHVMTLPGHVVPVGQSLTENQDLQWRICYTKAEIALIQSFNNIQVKVFVILRGIGKYILYPVCDDITSYIIKNVMLWTAEKNNLSKFESANLLELVEYGLHFLLKCVEKRHLPNYMIPERNLFYHKLRDENERGMLIKLLQDLLMNCKGALHTLCFGDGKFNGCLSQILDQFVFGNLVSKIDGDVMLYFTAEEMSDILCRQYRANRLLPFLYYRIYAGCKVYMNFSGLLAFYERLKVLLPLDFRMERPSGGHFELQPLPASLYLLTLGDDYLPKPESKIDRLIHFGFTLINLFLCLPYFVDRCLKKLNPACLKQSIIANTLMLVVFIFGSFCCLLLPFSAFISWTNICACFGKYFVLVETSSEGELFNSTIPFVDSCTYHTPLFIHFIICGCILNNWSFIMYFFFSWIVCIYNFNSLSFPGERKILFMIRYYVAYISILFMYLNETRYMPVEGAGISKWTETFIVAIGFLTDKAIILVLMLTVILSMNLLMMIDMVKG